MMFVSLCAGTIKPVFDRDNIYLAAVEGSALVHQVYTVSRMTDEERVDFSRAWRAGFEPE